MKIYSNRGMYSESLINRAINYHNSHNHWHLEKRNVPTKIIKVIQNDLVICKLLAKSTVDYCGYYHTKHIEFEAKQTINDYFDLNLIKSHQIDFFN